jgi:structure-specific endonuclease subunit SLX1
MVAGGGGGNQAKFFGCYLIGSQNPAMKGRSYVGFTVNPARRLQQHNGKGWVVTPLPGVRLVT